MKKSFKLKNLDCANCAQKMEDGIKKIPGVEEVAVSFLMQKITITAQDNEFDRIVTDVVKICRRIEPDCEIML